MPPVSMTAAVFWGLLPGAGQHFIAHKIGDAGLWTNRDSADLVQLRGTGTLMLATSWIPYVYIFTLPCGIEGVIVDVNRVNNLALLQHGEHLVPRNGRRDEGFAEDDTSPQSSPPRDSNVPDGFAL